MSSRATGSLIITTTRPAASTCDMNWKIIIDTFLEPYHFTPLHNDTVAPIFFPSLCLFEPFGRNLRETLPRRSIVELRDKPASDWDLIRHTAIVYVLFPNTVFVMQADHAEVWRVFPSDARADRSHVDLEFYIPEPATTEKARGTLGPQHGSHQCVPCRWRTFQPARVRKKPSPAAPWTRWSTGATSRRWLTSRKWLPMPSASRSNTVIA